MLLDGILIGLLSGWLSLLAMLFFVGRRVVKHPPEAMVRAMSKAMGRSMARQVSKAKNA